MSRMSVQDGRSHRADAHGHATGHARATVHDHSSFTQGTASQHEASRPRQDEHEPEPHSPPPPRLLQAEIKTPRRPVLATESALFYVVLDTCIALQPEVHPSPEFAFGRL